MTADYSPEGHINRLEKERDAALAERDALKAALLACGVESAVAIALLAELGRRINADREENEE